MDAQPLTAEEQAQLAALAEKEAAYQAALAEQARLAEIAYYGPLTTTITDVAWDLVEDGLRAMLTAAETREADTGTQDLSLISPLRAATLGMSTLRQVYERRMMTLAPPAPAAAPEGGDDPEGEE